MKLILLCCTGVFLKYIAELTNGHAASDTLTAVVLGYIVGWGNHKFLKEDWNYIAKAEQAIPTVDRALNTLVLLSPSILAVLLSIDIIYAKFD